MKEKLRAFFTRNSQPSEASIFFIAAPPELPDFGGLTILMAEDNAPLWPVIAVMLEKTGASCCYVENGAKCLEAFSAEPLRFDLILMDFEMPVMGGVESARLIRESGLPRCKDIPIIAMSGGFSAALKIQGLFSGVLPKPFDKESLLRAIASALSDRCAACCPL